MPNNDIRLLIGIPCYGDMPFEFVNSLTKLIRKLDKDGVTFELYFRAGTLIYLSRDAIVRYAVQNGFTHILWLDDDMVFDDDIYDRLSESGKNFVAGLCVSRHAKNGSVLFEDLYGRKRYSEYPTELFPIEGCGFACTLMKTSLATQVLDEYGTCFMPTLDFGEDLAFCERLLKRHIEMWAEPKAVVGHIANVVVYPDREAKYL